MRLWHKDLISCLPKQQLLGQWKECCGIASNIASKGTPNHILVNKILNYPLGHFYSYGMLVKTEMIRRGYKCDFSKFSKHFQLPETERYYNSSDIFSEWHNGRYFKQCYYNLQEKYDCGGLTEEEWRTINNSYSSVDCEDKNKMKEELCICQ